MRNKLEFSSNRYIFTVLLGFNDFISLFGKSHNLLIGAGLEKRAVVVPINSFKGGYGENFRKFKVFLKFENWEIFRN